MTRRANARVAGFTFLLYIALAIPAMILSGKATQLIAHALDLTRGKRLGQPIDLVRGRLLIW